MIPVPGFEGRRVAVFGLGRSGITAARALHAGGAIPILWDDGVSGRMQAEAEGFAVEDLSRADWSQFAALVLSPGAPLTHPKPHWTVDKATAAGVEIIGDIELFARAMDRTPGTVRPKVIAITGTNGKSTTTALIGWVLKQAGLKVAVGGNIGIGVLALPAPAEVGVYVIEVSSYQLDLTTSFAPDVAILTNISPDHLDRHGGMEGYVAAKARIFQNLDDARLALIGWVLKQAGLKVAVGGNIGIGVLALPAPAEVGVYVIEVSSYQLDLTTSFAPDVAILTNISPDHLDRHGGMEGYVAAKARIFAHAGLSLVGVDEDWGRSIAAAVAGARTVSTSGTPADISASDRRLTADGETIDLSAARSLPGRHNAQNAAFAWAAARAVGVPHDAAVQGLMTFPGLAHRMEEVGRLGRVRFINDSKATNADAARQALSSYERSFWIAGGRAKQGGIDDLEELFPRVVEAFLIGESAGPFAARLGETPHRISGDMASAVKAATEAAEATGREEVVLLSPAAASFDQYPDFEARGEAFRAAVLNLGATPSGHG